MGQSVNYAAYCITCVAGVGDQQVSFLRKYLINTKDRLEMVLALDIVAHNTVLGALGR